MTNRRSLIFFLFLLAAPWSVFAQTQTGTIEGTVQDDDGHPTPGVSITVLSPSLIGGSATTYTDQEGIYHFPWLASGTYEVRANLTGFQTAIQKDVRVFVGKTLTVNFKLEFATIAEAVEVNEKTPLIDESTTAVSFSIPPEIIYNLPKVQRIQDLLALTPGVIHELSAYGAEGENANNYSLDGVNVNDNLGNTPLSGGVYAPDLSGLKGLGGFLFGEFNYNWIEEVHVTGIGAPAEYGGFTGVSANFITRSGGNQFHGLFETFFQNEKLSDTNTPDPVIEFPFTSYDISSQLGGPLLRNKLWFFTGFEYTQRETHPFGYPEVTKETLPKFLAKLNYKLNENNSLQGYFHRNDPHYEGVGGSIIVLPEATSTLESTQSSWNSTWISLFSTQTNFEARFGGFYARLKSVETHPDLSGHVDNATGIYSVNAAARQDEKQSRTQLNATLSHYASDFLKGTHDFRFGVEFQRASEFFDFRYNGDFFYYDYNGTPFQRINTSSSPFDGDTHRTSFFAHDEWNIMKRFRLSLGVRWDHNRGITDLGAIFATDPVAPRIGFVWSVDTNSQTVIKGSYGDYYDALMGQHYNFLSENAHSTRITEEIDANGQWVEISRIRNNLALGDQKLKQPYVRQFSIGIDHVLPAEIPIGVHYIYRKFGNILEDVGLSGYEPVPFVNPLTGETITVYNRVDPEITFFYTNPSGLYRKYNAVEIFANKQIGNKISLLGSFVYSRSSGNYPGGNSKTLFLDDPNTTINFPGRLAEDFTWKFVGTYGLPWGLNTGWYFRHESGTTWAARVLLPPDVNAILPAIWAEPVGSRELPAQNLFDIRVEKQFPVYRGQLRFTVDIFNVFNSAFVAAVRNRFGNSTFGMPVAYNDPRELRLGVRYTF